jgi:hypothetical protein
MGLPIFLCLPNVVLAPNALCLDRNRIMAAHIATLLATLLAAAPRKGNRSMRKITLAIMSALPLSIALVAGFTLGPPAVGSAHASDRYPWCAVYSQRTVGATNCGFISLAQCRATISGVGGTCEPNPAYVSRQPRKPRY